MSTRASMPRGTEYEAAEHCPHCGHYCRATLHTELGSTTATIHTSCEHAELLRGEWEFFEDENLDI